MAVKNLIDKILKAITAILVAAICLVVIWQVITRFLLNNPSSWTEEISRYLLIWITFLGGSLGLCNGSHMSLVIITEKVRNKNVRTILHIFAYVICAGIGYIFVRYGWIYTLSGMKRTMMCCQIPIGYVYMIMPFSGIVIIINSVEIIFKDVLSIWRGNRKEG